MAQNAGNLMPLESGPDKPEIELFNLPPPMTPRTMWMLLFPGLTERILIECAIEIGVLQPPRYVEKLNSLNNKSWNDLRRKCAKRLGIEDPDKFESDLISETPIYKRWKSNLKQYMKENGTRD